MNWMQGHDKFIEHLTGGKKMLRSGDVEGMLDVVWEALFSYRENCIPEGTKEYDEEWSDICTAMAWIKEDLENYHNRDEDTPPDDPNWEDHL